VIFWSDGAGRKWKDQSSENARIDGSVFVPPFGMVVVKP
jgi:hypothetical protein